MTKDLLLSSFAQRAGEQSTIREVTICVNGIMISGILCSPKEYYETIMKLPTDKENSSEEESKYLEELFASIDKHSSEYQEAEPGEIEYIYLKNTSVLGSNGIIKISNLMLQVKIESIDAFGVGVMESI